MSGSLPPNAPNSDEQISELESPQQMRKTGRKKGNPESNDVIEKANSGTPELTPPEPAKMNFDPGELLLKELEERHLYSRFIAQAYLAWYTFFVTLNLTIMGVSLAHLVETAPYKNYMVVSFLIFNALGIFTTLVILRGTDNQRNRIDEIIGLLNSGKAAGLSHSFFLLRIVADTGRLTKSLFWKNPSPAERGMKSPYPYYLFTLLPIIFAISHGVLMGCWYLFWNNGS